MAKDLKSCRVLVTPTTYGKNDPRLRTELEAAVGEVIYNRFGRPLASSEVRKMLGGVDGYIAGLDYIDRNALEGADRLKVIARYGVGVDRIDLPAAADKSIVVTNTPEANSSSVAELTIGFMLSLARLIPKHAIDVRAGLWPSTNGWTIQGKTVGLLGFGSIGKEVAKRLCAWGCRLLAYDPYPDLVSAREMNIGLKTQTEVIGMADFLSLHLPVLPETRHMVNEEFLARMKQGSFLINTARGELIDEKALLYALKSGHLAGAALDVFSQEPPSPENPLFQLPQVISTPHLGAHTDGAADAMGWSSLNDCLAVLRDQKPKHQVISKIVK
jgi:phosphoglycerate dehydrogenase-like enzyme